MLISFAVCTHNEGEYIQKLMDQLIPYCKETGDEIVILDDFSFDTRTREILESAQQHEFVHMYFGVLNKDFAGHKNDLNHRCSGDYIFQIDADETLHPSLLENLQALLETNYQIQLFAIPRVNVVNGLTQDDINKWGWSVTEKGYVAWPDYQTRLYRNSPDIKWEGKVHERIVGYKTVAPLPAEEEWAIIHIKDIDRQRKQNEFYSTI